MWTNWNMSEVENIPTISDGGLGDGHRDEAELEQVMIGIRMLEQSGKWTEALRDAREQLEAARTRASQLEAENEALKRKIETSLPQQELEKVRHQLLEKEQEIGDLRAERHNSLLLLEHLESLVAQHEKPLKPTLLAQNSMNETELLGALKSLFEHHKALDAKVHGKLRKSGDRINFLEQEISNRNKEIKFLRDITQLQILGGSSGGTEVKNDGRTSTESWPQLKESELVVLASKKHGAPKEAPNTQELNHLAKPATLTPFQPSSCDTICQVISGLFAMIAISVFCLWLFLFLIEIDIK